MKGLYPFQRQCVEFALKHRYTLNGCEMGLGKSRIALALARETGGRVAVFGPPVLRSSWELEGKAVGVGFDYFPYTLLHKFDSDDLGHYRLWIADECHMLKSPTARRTHAFYSLLKHSRPEYFLGLSGTPIKNRVPDLWTLLAFCSLCPVDGINGLRLTGDLAKYGHFARHFCNTEILKVRGRRIEKFTGVKEERLPELKALLREKYLRYRVADVLPDLPALTRKEVPLVISGDIPGLKEAFLAYSAGRKVDTAAKVLNALLKAPLTSEYVKSLIDGGSGPVLVFTDHRDSAAALFKSLDGAKVITGATSMEDRAEIVEEFQRGKVPYLIATIGALSVGVTLHASRHVVFNDLNWTPSDNSQAEKRVHRIGQKNATLAHYITASPTDTYIMRTLVDKMNTISQVVEC